MTDAKRTHLLTTLKRAEDEFKAFEKECIGPGIGRAFKRLGYFHLNYLRYIAPRFHITIAPIELVATTFWGKDFLLPLADLTSLCIHRFGLLWGEEHKLTKFFVRYVQEKDIFYDIGSSYGFYSVLAKELISEGQIHAFEPEPASFRYVKSNTTPDNKRIFVVNKAVGNKNGTVPFYNLFSGNVSGSSTTIESVARLQPVRYQRIDVEAVTLDTYCATHTMPTILKIDVEGAEGDVIEGGIRMLTTAGPLVAMEIWQDSQKNARQLQATDALCRLGYKPHKINEKGMLESLKGIHPETDISSVFGFDNFIFKKYV